jgi:hypothetical protein
MKISGSTKIVFWKILIYDGEIFFTVHTTLIQQICSNLGVIKVSKHKTQQTGMQKKKIQATRLYCNGKIVS